MRAGQNGNLLDKLRRTIKRAGIEQIDFKDKYVAIKIHFGEFGNMAYIRPGYAAVVVDLIKSLGGKPFLTDSNTLYTGFRSNAVDHLDTANRNGFNRIVTGCDVIIADGLKGKDERAVNINGKYCPAPLIGSAIADADIIISMTHFKGHEMAGFGGTMKNLGMGSGSVAGKKEMHSSAQPKINADKCIGCKICEKNCAHNAAHVIDKKAVIDYRNCVGCGQCVALCPNEAAVMSSQESSCVLNYKIAEYTKAVLNGKPQFHISFIMNVSPECDCWAHNDAAIVPDLGIAASFDPVALDQACADMVNQAPLLTTGNVLQDKMTHSNEGECSCGHHGHVHAQDIHNDKFRMIHPDTNWQACLEYSEEIGLGTRKYELVKV